MTTKQLIFPPPPSHHQDADTMGFFQFSVKFMVFGLSKAHDKNKRREELSSLGD
jgi:hypothetical protein